MQMQLFLTEDEEIYPEAAEFILRAIATDLQHPTRRNQSLSPQKQLLIALHFVGNGAQYHVIGDMHGLSKSTVCPCVNKVADVIINKLFGAHIRWPTQNREEIAEDFYRSAGLPRVAGVVDGTLIPMDAPHLNEAAYVDRHGNHSIYTMVVAGPQLRFFYASARWPGNAHDSRVLRNSSLHYQWNVEGWRPFPNALIFSDSAYFNRNWILTPVVNNAIYPQNGVRLFLRRLKATRHIVECALDVLKEEFPCLNHLRLKKPETCARIILMCIIIHNIQNNFRHNEHNIDIEDYNDMDDGNYDHHDDGEESNLIAQREVIELMNME